MYLLIISLFIIQWAAYAENFHNNIIPWKPTNKEFTLEWESLTTLVMHSGYKYDIIILSQSKLSLFARQQMLLYR